MTRRVFDEPNVHRDSGLSAAEPEVTWFTEVSRPEASVGRWLINDLYSRFPDETGRMWSGLHATDNRQFFSALDELFVHDLLARHYRVAYEEGTGTRPDFRLYRGTEYAGIVEVLTLFQRDEWDADERRHHQLAGEINRRLSLTTHSVTFDIQRWDGTPSVKHIVGWLESAIGELDEQSAALDLDAGGAVRTYNSRSAEIIFEFLPLPPGYRIAADDAAVVGGECTGGLIDTAARLRDRLDAKAGKYRAEGKPYAIVVGARDRWCEVDEVHRALTGTPGVVVRTGEAVRRGDGFFGVGREHPQGKHRQVSAVYSLHDWFPGGPYRPRITRFDNPFAGLPFPDDALPHGGHWGVFQRDARRVYADWLITAEGPLEA